MERAMGDPSFHKALNGFLYSYFIQNYNWLFEVQFENRISDFVSLALWPVHDSLKQKVALVVLDPPVEVVSIRPLVSDSHGVHEFPIFECAFQSFSLGISYRCWIKINVPSPCLLSLSQPPTYLTTFSAMPAILLPLLMVLFRPSKLLYTYLPWRSFLCPSLTSPLYWSPFS